MLQPQSTFQSRPFFYMMCVGILVAWAVVGIATGHTYLMYWRAAPADFDGWAAVAFSIALLVAAMAMSVRMVLGRPRKGEWRASSFMFLISFTLIAVAMACELAPRVLGISAPTQFTGLVAEGSLRSLLNASWVAAFAASALPAVFSWLKISCIVLVGLAIVFKIFGVTRKSTDDHPALAAALYLVFGFPFLAWISLELIQYVFGILPSAPAKPFDSFHARASLVLSALVAISGLWLFALLAMLALALRAIGVSVQWQKTHPPDEAIDAF